MRCEVWPVAFATLVIGNVLLLTGVSPFSPWRAAAADHVASGRRLNMRVRPSITEAASAESAESAEFGPGLQRPFWNDSVLPPNVASQRLSMVKNPHYGLHVFALGANGSIWHKFQTGPMNLSVPLPYAPMSPWHCLTPNASLVWGNDPSVALNADGHIELIIGLQADSLDLWQMYQTNASDPLAWHPPRGPTCICDAPDPTACPWCNNCASREECRKNYWLGYAPFTTSDAELFLDPVDQKLKLNFRNFDGHVYQLSQAEPNNSERWSPTTVQFAIFE